ITKRNPRTINNGSQVKNAIYKHDRRRYSSITSGFTAPEIFRFRAPVLSYKDSLAQSMMSTASFNNDILNEAMQALEDNISALQTPVNEDNAAQDRQVQANPQLQPPEAAAKSGPAGSELRETWFSITGILHGLRKFEDFRMVLPILDLVKGKFPQDIRDKLHDMEFQKEEDFDLDAVMRHLDNIIASKEKYEDSTMLSEDSAVYVSAPQRGRTRTPSPRRRDSNICYFCDSPEHGTPQSPCSFDEDVFAQLHSAIDACAKDTPQRHANADHANTVETSTTSFCARIEKAGAQDPFRVTTPDRVKVATVVITVIDRRPWIAIPQEVHPGAEDAPGVRHTIDITAHARTTDTSMDRTGEKNRTRQGDDIDLHPHTSRSSPPGEAATMIAPEDHFRVHHRSTLHRRRITSSNSSNRRIWHAGLTQVRIVDLFDEKLRTLSLSRSVHPICRVQTSNSFDEKAMICHCAIPVDQFFQTYWHTGFSRGSSPRRYSHTHSTADWQNEDEAIEGLWSLDSLGIVDEHHPDADTELDQRILDKSVAKILRTCVTCRKVNALPYRYPNMPSLPTERITRSRPFQAVGIDYLGPIQFQSAHTTVSKAWVCLISCMSTRAVHLELINNTVQEFLLSIRSESSTTFHAAESAITEVLDSFWDIWHSDYLAALRERQQIPHRRKRSATKTSKEGDIVLMADDKLPRGQWPLGAFKKTCYGQDNVARSATVRTSAERQLIRSLAHLYPLEISAPDVSDSPGSDSSPTPSPKRIQPSRAAKTAHKVGKSGSL
ncbi:unnamed protein product, partial [Heligmosomoides polygyrus]